MWLAVGGGAHLPQHVTIQLWEPTPQLQGRPLCLSFHLQTRVSSSHLKAQVTGWPFCIRHSQDILQSWTLTAGLAGAHQKLLLYPGGDITPDRKPPLLQETCYRVSPLSTRPGPGASLKDPKNLQATSENNRWHPGKTLGPGCSLLSARVPEAGCRLISPDPAVRRGVPAEPC